jgi:hypothetical protein
MLHGSKEYLMKRLFQRVVGRRPNPVASRKPRSGFRPRIEALEDRLVMTSPASVLAPAAPVITGGLPGNIATLLGQVDLTTTPDQAVSGSLSASKPQTYKVSLKAGDMVFLKMQPGFSLLDVQQDVAAIQGTTLTITGPQGVVRQIAPPAGVGSLFGLPDAGFQAGAAGTYSVSITARSSTAFSYTLDLHRLALAQGPQNAASLEQSGSMYAFLTGTGSNRTLSLTGPTGYGFAITGNWTQASNNTPGSALRGSTYTATGALTLQTALGPVPLAVPKGQQFIVTTAANEFGQYFGAVQSIQADFGLALGTYVGEYTQALTQIGLNMSKVSVLNDDWTIELGSQVSPQRGGAEVLSGVPYLVYGGQAGYQASFGGLSINQTLGSSASSTVIIADPSDPFLYVGHVAQNGTLDWQFAGSLNGRIPYTPEYKPTMAPAAALTQFFGQVFAAGTFDLSDLTGLPLSVTGGVTMNLAADGQFLGGQPNASQLFGGHLSALSGVFKNIDVGVNAALNLGYDVAGYNFTLRLGGGSAVYNGPLGGLWLRGVKGTDNPLAGTPFAWLTFSETDSVEAALYANGHFSITAETEWDVLGSPVAFTLTLTNSGIAAQTTGSAKWELDKYDYVSASFTATLSITDNAGQLDFSGSVTATGTLATFLGSTSGSVSAWVTNEGISFDIFGYDETIAF